MKEIEGEAGNIPACGYGLLGLCCSACLLGPCRLNPFQGKPEKGQCGDDRDHLVARNLLRLALQEASQEINTLRETVLKLRSCDPAELHYKDVTFQEVLFEKYGFLPHLSREKLSHIFLIELKDLLSLFPEGAISFLSLLYPATIFPVAQQLLQPDKAPSSSLLSLYLDSVEIAKEERSGVEDILNQSLRISLLSLISEELRHDMSCLLGKEPASEDKQNVLDAFGHLSLTPHPILIHLSDGDQPRVHLSNRMANDIAQTRGGEESSISIKNRHVLPDIGRRLFAKWNQSTAEIKALAFISSRRVTSILGALGLGYTVASSPHLPIHGSDRVEKFFVDDFEKKLGNAYLLLGQEATPSSFLDFMRQKK